MKIYVTYDSEDHNMVRSVRTLSYFEKKGKTEEEIDAAVIDRNKEYGWTVFRTFEVNDELENVFRFMLGENEYKRCTDITDVYDKLNDIKNDIDSIRDDVFHMNEYLESVIDDIKELVPEEDR